MKSIEARFRKMQRKYPYHSSFINFGRAVRGQRFKRSAVARNFMDLVEKHDYSNNGRTNLIAHFLALSEDKALIKKY